MNNNHSRYLKLQQILQAVPKITLLEGPTPLIYLKRLSQLMERDIYIKRDDLTPLALGGNKLRKLEYLVADALAQKADMLITAGAIQSNHVCQTAAVAAHLGLKCVALLENPIATHAGNYLTNGNRHLLDLFDCQIEMCEEIVDEKQQLADLADQYRQRGFRPYIIPVGGSNALGALGYLNCASEIYMQGQAIDFGSIVVSSGSAGTHVGLALGIQYICPNIEVIGVTISRPKEQQFPKVDLLQQQLVQLSNLPSLDEINLWDDYYLPGYALPNLQANEAIALMARLEGILLDPVYTGKAVAGLLDGIKRNRFSHQKAILFIHTGGAPALFAYHPHI